MFQLPRTVDYSMLILLALYEADEDTPLSAAAVAERCCLPPHHVAKILKHLQRHGVVRSRRGPRGGYQLAMPAAELNLSFIYSLFEGPLHLSDCLLDEGPACSAVHCCRLKSHLNRLNHQVDSLMSHLTIPTLSQGPEPKTFRL